MNNFLYDTTTCIYMRVYVCMYVYIYMCVFLYQEYEKPLATANIIKLLATMLYQSLICDIILTTYTCAYVDEIVRIIYVQKKEKKTLNASLLHY